MDAAAYDEMRRIEDRHFWFRGKREVLEPLLASALDAAGPGWLVDLGCGTGGNLAWLARRFPGRPALGVDAAPQPLVHARGRGLDAPLVLGQGARLPLADGGAACATALDVLEHAEDDGALLAELARVLRPGGRLVASVPAYPWLWAPHDEALGHVRRYRRGELEGRLEGHGFRVERSHGFNFLLLPLIAATRWTHRLRKRRGTDFFGVGPLNEPLYGVLRLERRIVARVDVPFGVSTFVRAVRT